MNHFVRFLADDDKNLFHFTLRETDNETMVITIDSEFEFSINPKTLTVSSSEEFLADWINVLNVNRMKSNSIEDLLVSCTKNYAILMGIDDLEESPLYSEGQQILELENDNFDMKFVDRIRLSQDDFNMDLLSTVFCFLYPRDTARFSRVCKSWSIICADDVLWKQYCNQDEIFEKTAST